MPPKTAYLTGGASGIGRAVTERLVARGIQVAVADINLKGAEEVASTLNAKAKAELVFPYQVDVADWESQRKAFEQACVQKFGRVDLVFPIAGIGEREGWIPNDPKATGFTKPDLTALDVNLNGALYTASLGIQQMRRQDKDESGFRGKVLITASICGFYCSPTIPVYTASKHGVIGFVRSYGKFVIPEGITINAVCPNVVRTGIQGGGLHDELEEKGLLTDINDVVDAFESFVDNEASGECAEVGPNGGFTIRKPAEYLDPESETVVHEITRTNLYLHELKG